MFLELCSTAAFAPPPPIAIYEPSGRVGSGVAPLRARTSPPQTNITTATTDVGDESAPRIHTHFAQMAADLFRRIQSLKIEAELDAVPFSTASYADFLSFLKEARPQSRPSLFLNDNGNLRALWRNDAREQIGLQFLGGGNIQFVIFKHRPGADAMTRVAGVDAKSNILAHIKASGAQGLLAA